MPLTDCPVCGRQISVEAEACPQCGHPNRPSAPEGPECYACSAVATTRCQSCGAFSCAQHLQSIYVSHGKSGAYELRCESCYSSAQVRKAVGCVVFFVFLIGIVIFLSQVVAR